MSRRSSSQNSVSLFPFLAVLVCTMGALILLLIAMTKKIQQQAAARRTLPVLSIQGGESLTLPKPPEPRILPDPEPELVEVSGLPELSAPPAPDRSEEQAALVARWKADVDAAQAERDRLLHAVTSQRGKLNLLLAQIQQLETDEASHQRRLAALAAQGKELAEQEKLLAAAQEKLDHQFTLTRKQIDSSRQRQSTGPSPYSLVPYDGTSGTVRRPIYIECTDVGLKFLPEGETITARDLEGFTEGYNPLLSGTVALLKYWNEQRVAQGKEEPEPYVLLLVRPSGSVAYYIARRLLVRLDVPFGYELIDEDWKLDIPAADPHARTLVRTAVNDTLKARDDVLDAMSSRGKGSSRGGSGPSFDPAVDRGPSSSKTASRGSQRRIPDGFDAESRNEVATSRSASGTAARRGSGRGNDIGEIPTSARPAPEQPGRPLGNGEHRLTHPAALPAERGTGGGRTKSGTGLGGDQKPAHFGDLGGNSLGTDDLPRTTDPERVFDGATARRPGGNSSSGEQSPGDGDTAAATANGTQQSKVGKTVSRTKSTGAQRGSASRGGSPDDLPQEALPEEPEEDWRSSEVPGREPGGPLDRKPAAPGSRMPASRSGDLAEEQPGEVDPTEENNVVVHNQIPLPKSSRPKSSEEKGNTFSGQFGPKDQDFGDKPHSRSAGSEETGDSKRPVKRWGYSGGKSTIGLEKKLEIHCLPDKILIGPNDATVFCGKGETKDQLHKDVLAAIEQVSLTWGKPPRNFYWIPVIRFVVYPGGNQHYERLHNSLRELGLFSTVEFTVRDVPKKTLQGALK